VAAQTVLEQVSLDLLRPLFPPLLGVRLLGVTVSGLDGRPCRNAAQLALGFQPKANLHHLSCCGANQDR